MFVCFRERIYIYIYFIAALILGLKRGENFDLVLGM